VKSIYPIHNAYYTTSGKSKSVIGLNSLQQMLISQLARGDDISQEWREDLKHIRFMIEAKLSAPEIISIAILR
jgi:hypothetical protein